MCILYTPVPCDNLRAQTYPTFPHWCICASGICASSCGWVGSHGGLIRVKEHFFPYLGVELQLHKCWKVEQDLALEFFSDSACFDSENFRSTVTLMLHRISYSSLKLIYQLSNGTVLLHSSFLLLVTQGMFPLASAF